MGLTSSTYCSCQTALLAKQMIMGDKKEEDNAYHWAHVQENLPFVENYNVSVAHLRKVQTDGHLASEVLQYVDNLRIISFFFMEMAWRSSSQMAKGLCWYGLQDAARKRMRASQQLGAWAGSVVITDGDVVTKSIMKERWEKTKDKIRWLGLQAGVRDEFTRGNFPGIEEGVIANLIHFKTTEKYIGFVVYVSQTYTSLVPYLKGIYLTLNSWRNGQDVEGWGTPEGIRMRREGIP